MDARARALISIATLLAVLGCGGEPAPPRPERAGGCELSAVETWVSPARGSLGIAEPAIAALVDRGAVTVRPLGGRVRRFTLEGAEAVVALERIGDHYVLITYGACGGAPCLLAQLLDRAGAAMGESVRSPFVARVRTSRRASDDTAAYLAWSADAGTRALEIWRREGATLVHETIALGAEPATVEAPVEILGVTGGWAVIWRRGPLEAHESALFVTTPEGHAAVEVLHEALAIESLTMEDGVVSAIAPFEFSRPHLVRVRGGASEPISARELAADAAIPAPFAGRVRAHLDRDDEGLWLRRVSAAGDPIGERVRVAEGELEGARISGRDGVWNVAWLTGGAVVGRTVTCR